MTLLHLSRRRLLAGMAVALPTLAHGQSMLDATSLGIVPDSDADQSEAMQRALDSAAAAGQTLRLPRGNITVRNLNFPGNLTVEGVPGGTTLLAFGFGLIANISGQGSVVLRDIGFAAGSAGDAPALLTIEGSDAITLERCLFRSAPLSAITITDAAVTIRDCEFTGHGDAAIHSMDSRGLHITGNRISDCGNAGIRIWRTQSGPDGSIITENRISNINATDGGNGANGNGINVFKADEVIVSDNHIADCAFTAVRLNTTNNTQVSGNTCLRSGETAIYSEFAFSGSVIANNIIDGAAIGISMTNYNEGGRLAVCTGNIVRNIAPKSLVNPDASPVGIYAEAEAAITGNTIHHVPGAGIVAGYGPYLSNVLIANNVLYDILTGVGVSVAPGAGNAQVTNNMIFDPQHAIVGMAWDEMVDPDLIANAGNYPLLTIANNTVGEVQGV